MEVEKLSGKSSVICAPWLNNIIIVRATEEEKEERKKRDVWSLEAWKLHVHHTTNSQNYLFFLEVA